MEPCTRGLPEPLRRAAAELYWEAFGRKLRPALGGRDRGVAVIERSLDPDRAVVAVDGGELVGLAGFHAGDGSFVPLRLGQMAAVYGRLSALWRLAPLALLDRAPNRGELLIDGIVVRQDRRGHGVGTALLHAICDLARGEGLERVCLDVVDTNPDARRLYEREGFTATTTERTPHLRGLMGFSAATTMVREVGPDARPGRPKAL